MILIAFGFLFVIFLIITLFLWVLKLIFKKKIFNTIILGLWVLFFSLPVLLIIESIFTSKKEIDKDDIYGEYVINKNKCPGKQADWQYEHYRFKITKDNKLHFFIFNDNKKLIKTIVKNIEINYYSSVSPHLDIKPTENDFHILKQNPTLYREVWSFYYVFESEKFGNMFFTKKKWYEFS